MQEKASQPRQSRLSKIGPVCEPGTTMFMDDAAMGIIKVVSANDRPRQDADEAGARPGSPSRKTCQVSLLTWELKR